MRALARRRLPGALWTLPKRGFTAPMREWLARSHAEQFRAEVLTPHATIAAHLDLDDLRHRFASHRAGNRDHSYVLWAAWVLERWLTAAKSPAPAKQRIAHNRQKTAAILDSDR